jgi:hypothetical protein
MGDDAISRVERYIEVYEDAPNWGGPTMYPKAPAIADLRELVSLARKSLDRLSPNLERE